MIAHGTVFVLGAGANVFCGFPAGPTLRTELQKLLGSSGDSSSLQKCGIETLEMDELIKALKYTESIHGTIDELLGFRKSLRNVGAHAVALAMLRKERIPAVCHGVFSNSSANWYKRLHEYMHSSGSSDKSPIDVFITFNYDRSLEYYLDRTINTGYEEEDAKSLAANCPRVHHIHGSLGELREVPFESSPPEPETVSQCAKGLIFIKDPRDTRTPAIAVAREHISNAKNIAFIGFGYDDANLEKLGVLEQGVRAKLYGTAWAQSSREFRDWRANVIRKFDEQGKQILIPDKMEDNQPHTFLVWLERTMQEKPMEDAVGGQIDPAKGI